MEPVDLKSVQNRSGFAMWLLALPTSDENGLATRAAIVACDFFQR